MYYLRQHQNDTAKLLKVSFSLYQGIIKSVNNDNPRFEDRKVNKTASDKFLGILYLTNVDKDKYQNLLR